MTAPAQTVRELMDRDPNWLTTLAEIYKVKATRDGDLVSIKYDMIESPMHEPIVAQCRGMVVDVARNVIVAHPYNKFWNHGEKHADVIDWSTARVQEKLDGSLLLLWWSPIDLKWCVSSSGHPTAGGPFGYDASRTFAEAFWQTFEALGMKLPSTAGATYMLELCAKQNRVVVKHDTPRLVLHGARNMASGAEITRPWLEHLARELHWEIVQEYPIGSIEECLRSVDQLDPIVTEGYIVVDADHRRVKIKSPGYVLLHLLRGEGMSQKRAITLWQKGDTAEVLAVFPEFTEETDQVQAQIDAVINGGFALWYANREAPTRKDFAAAVNQHPGCAIAFKLWADPAPSLDVAREIVRGMNVPAIQRAIEAIT